MRMLLGVFDNRKIQLAIIVLLTSLVYSNTLKNSFVIEDPVYISDWKLTQNLANIPKMFAGDTAPTGNVGIYRPLRAVFYAATFRLFGGDNPFPYHLLALAVHLSITVLVYLIVWEILCSKVSSPRSSWGPFIVALLFGLHPVHSEAVDYLTANFDAISYIFFFGSFFFYLKWRLRKWEAYYWSSVILATLAFFHFEMTLTLPFLLILADLTLVRGPALISSKFKVQSSKLEVGSPSTASTPRSQWSIISCQLSVVRYFPYFVVAGVYLFVRIVVLKMTIRSDYLAGSFYLTMLTMLKVFVKYIQMLVLPVDLSINPRLPGGISAWVHPLAHMERISNQSIFDPIILFSLVVLACLVLAIFYFKTKQPVVSFAIGWFLISLLPVSYIIPQGTIFQERYIYIASLGFVILLIFGFDFLFNFKFKKEVKEFIKPALIISMFAILAFYGIRTSLRNRDWKDSFAVWSKLAGQFPDDVIANFSTARIHAQRNNFDAAIDHYRKALAVEPRLFEVRYDLGGIYEKQGKADQAATEYQQTLLINPGYDPAKEALDRINNNKVDTWKECRLSNEVTFFCPSGWITLKNYGLIKIREPEGDFIIELTSDSRGKNQSIDDYLKSPRDNLGQLANEGLAQIPNFDKAYVKVWKRPISTDNEPISADQLLMQFFLFKNDKVVKILVSPGDSPRMVKFDRLVSSLKIE